MPLHHTQGNHHPSISLLLSQCPPGPVHTSPNSQGNAPGLPCEVSSGPALPSAPTFLGHAHGSAAF